MQCTLKLLLINILILLLSSCGNRLAGPEDVSSFCEKVKIGDDFSEVIASLPSKALALRDPPSFPEHHIFHSLPNRETIQSALITAEGLAIKNIDPACLIYFSSIFHQGSDKILFKQMIGETYKGI